MANYAEIPHFWNPPSPTFILILVQSKSKYSQDMRKYWQSFCSVKAALSLSQLFLRHHRLVRHSIFLLFDTLRFRRQFITNLWSTRPSKSSSTESNIHCRNSFFCDNYPPHGNNLETLVLCAHTIHNTPSLRSKILWYVTSAVRTWWQSERGCAAWLILWYNKGGWELAWLIFWIVRMRWQSARARASKLAWSIFWYSKVACQRACLINLLVNQH